MHRHIAWPLAALAAGLVILPGCGSANTVAGSPLEAGRVVSIAGGHQVELSDVAAKRLGIQTAPVTEMAAPTPADPASPAAAPLLVIPIAALLYDKNGATWVYVSSKLLTYQRQAVVVDHITGDTAVLRSGPAAGTAVVTVGAVELLGTEFGVAGGG
jgi:hypothetical protein